MSLPVLKHAAYLLVQAGHRDLAVELRRLADKWEEQIPGGLAEGHSPDEFDQEQLDKGIIVEKEHSPDIKVRTEISMDHLTEDPKYYDNPLFEQDLKKAAHVLVSFHGSEGLSLATKIKEFTTSLRAKNHEKGSNS